ncbi:peptidyl-prolyl cis-trans isomerase FKBP8 [Condylostylus longicornis]|uniref:peptidyl-prolyl cis-trans isomerase FKBP8 n=1 Tax=Condylostylus longicornis TaxID=2530218 RepID=UPI00244DB90B|nr:peptidyl-prolyl cis-trans isomerase FKBP8 [Condylostylus longicornis]
MDTEKSSNSSFEDLTNLNENDIKDLKENAQEDKVSNSEIEDDILDILGNGQLTKKTLVKSSSDVKAQRGHIIKMNYVGKLEDGTIVEEQQNYEVQVGDFDVVQGLDMTLALMSVGEKAEISVDPRFAYGSIGLKAGTKYSIAAIPPDAKIIYTVELLDTREEDEESIKLFEVRKKIGNQKRERANWWYNRNEFNIAIQIYRRALEYLDDINGGITDGVTDAELSNSELQELLEDRLIVYNNLAMSQIKISAYDAALKSVETVLRCQPNNSKALFRKGKILDAKGDTKGAISLLQKAATLEPESKTIQQELAKLIIKSRREERNEKIMYQKMLGRAKKLEQNNTSNKQVSTDLPKLKLLGYLMGSILIGVAGVAMYRYKY